MSNFFTEVLNDLDGLEQDLLGPDYSYYKEIKSPKEIGMSSDGNIGAMVDDIAGLIAYTKLLVEGGGKASRVNGPLGDKFFLKTGAKCKDTATGNQVHRSIYINNVPDGDIPFISSGLGTDFTTFEGLIPGTLGNLANINPLEIFQAFMSGTNPDCTATTLQTINTKNEVEMGTGYLTTADIKGMNPCWFPDHKNPITNETRSGCNPTRPSTQLPQTNGKCMVKPGFPFLLQSACSQAKNNIACNKAPECIWDAAESFQNMKDITSVSNVSEISSIIAYLYFISLVLLFCYLLTKVKK